MSSNKNYYIAFLLLAVLFVVTCNEKEKIVPEEKTDISTPEAALKEARKILGNNAQVALAGNFGGDSTREFVAGTEVNKPDKWGIQFHLLKKEGNIFHDAFSTDLLKGSFTGAFIGKEKLQSEKFDMLYYNSLDYFMGSGGGEVFTYLIDFKNKKTFYAHLFIEQGKSISLFLSENVTPEIKNFFLSLFKKDYPDLKIAGKDVDLDD